MILTKSDFNVRNPKESRQLRSKMGELVKEIIPYTNQINSSMFWDYYVTNKNNSKQQWAALFPMPVKGREDSISQCANVYFNIPQVENEMVIAANMEFVIPKNQFGMKCSKIYINQLLQVIQAAKGATIRIGRKEVRRDQGKEYRWLNQLWDSERLPEIETSQCTLEYLRELQNSIQQPCKDSHRDSWWKYEAYILIGYRVDISEVIGKKDIQTFIGSRVQLLAPIVEYVMK